MSYKRAARWMRKRKVRQQRLRRQRHAIRYATGPRYSFSTRPVSTAKRYRG